MTDHPHQLTRRQTLQAAGVALGATMLPVGVATLASSTATAASTASLTPELTEGPYWVNTMLRRSDVRGNSDGTKIQEGVPLDLYVNVLNHQTKKPINGLAVDIWHANAYGLYSDESSQQAGGGDGESSEDTSSENFLRGYQLTGKDKGLADEAVDGQVSFQTIWPGWYTSRAIHIHVRVRKLHSSGKTIAGFTTQIFFKDADNTRIFEHAAPYNTRDPQDDPTTDQNDTVLTKADFDTNIVSVKGNLSKGYTATFDIGVTNKEINATGSLSRPNMGTGRSRPDLEGSGRRPPGLSRPTGRRSRSRRSDPQG